MAEYALYVESGPKRRKTMVHVLDLLGCIAQGPTTDAALEGAPEAIRAYLRFLKRHGESVAPGVAISIRVVEHIMEGVWLGYGDPTPGFSLDFQPLSSDDLSTHLRRLGWLREDLSALIINLPPDQRAAKPEGFGRSIREILEHIAESQTVYLRYLVGKVEGLSEALRAVRQSQDASVPALTHLWQISTSRLSNMTDAERRQSVPHGQVTWTARRALRRMLEHDWEHFLEISARLGVSLD